MPQLYWCRKQNRPVCAVLTLLAAILLIALFTKYRERRREIGTEFGCLHAGGVRP